MIGNKIGNKIVSIVFLVIFASACTPGLGPSSGSHLDIFEASGRDEYRYELVESVNNFSIELQIQAEKGVFHWKVIDPQGEVAWEGQVQEQDFTETKELPMQVGIWTLEVNLANATGSYNYTWHTK